MNDRDQELLTECHKALEEMGCETSSVKDTLIERPHMMDITINCKSPRVRILIRNGRIQQITAAPGIRKQHEKRLGLGTGVT